MKGCQVGPIPIKEVKKTHELIFSWFFGYRYCSWAHTHDESRKMAARLQMIGRQRHAALVYRVLLKIYDIMS